MAARTQWLGRWAHGRIKQTRRRPRFILEARRDGRRYAIPLEARNEGQALLEWKAFDENPEEFRLAQQTPDIADLWAQQDGWYAWLVGRGCDAGYSKTANLLLAQPSLSRFESPHVSSGGMPATTNCRGSSAAADGGARCRHAARPFPPRCRPAPRSASPRWQNGSGTPRKPP
jgi:hypothetical protein